MAKAPTTPLYARIPRKAIPTGCGKAWWYLSQNGDITIYTSEPSTSCIIKAHRMKALLKALKARSPDGRAKT